MSRYAIKNRRRRLAVVLILVGVCVLAVVLDRQIYPIVADYSAARAKANAGIIINTAVAELLKETQVTYEDLIHLTKDAAGNVRSAEVDAMTVNRLKTMAEGQIRQRVNGQQMTVKIPVGNLTGSAYLSGRGPAIPVKLKLSTNVLTHVVSEFIDTGINQSLHIIKLTVDAEIFLLLPSGRSSVSYTTDYLLGQTVIVGEVPDAFTNVLTGEDDIEGLIEDFGAQVSE